MFSRIRNSRKFQRERRAAAGEARTKAQPQHFHPKSTSDKRVYSSVLLCVCAALRRQTKCEQHVSPPSVVSKRSIRRKKIETNESAKSGANEEREKHNSRNELDMNVNASIHSLPSRAEFFPFISLETRDFHTSFSPALQERGPRVQHVYRMSRSEMAVLHGDEVPR